ncbi:MarR family winged helix-turn-helix transcriptional regulator [Peribacillus sp. NPDC097675]|uniref:MarR family winged helix-turn-helix transcriptional regulator n=1 Tax=Peribacillus sp. NPDC097675 TaxID=3390618 RepID=UPI003D0099FE
MKISIKDYMSIMIHQTDLTLTRYIKAKLAPLNIAPEQNLILLLLWGKDGRSQNEIAKSLLKDKTNITRMLDNLEKKELITRRVNESDSRSYNVYLTEKGIKLGEEVYPITEEFNRIVCSGITSEELQIANKVLLKIQKNIESNTK